MRIAILLTGTRPWDRVKAFGTCQESFETFLHHRGIATAFECFNGNVPSVAVANTFDLIIIPGASKSVNWERAWMLEIERLITDPQRTAWIFGVCFGHQLIAKAYGGVVVESPHGWELGVHTVRINPDLKLSPEYAELTVLQSHKMQVSTCPPEISVWATGSPDSWVQGLISRERKIFSTQFHPEYSKEYFLASRTSAPLDADQINKVNAAFLDHDKVSDMLLAVMA